MDGSEKYTVLDYLAAKVKFDIPAEAMKAILLDRGIDPDTDYADRDADAARLAYADMLKWITMGPSKKNNSSETDNSWTHSGGGYEIDDEDRKLLIAEANAIYKELDPASTIRNKTTFRMNSAGIKHCNYDMGHNPMPHLIR